MMKFHFGDMIVEDYNELNTCFDNINKEIYFGNES